jgi:hypothetical protein
MPPVQLAVIHYTCAGVIAIAPPPVHHSGGSLLPKHVARRVKEIGFCAILEKPMKDGVHRHRPRASVTALNGHAMNLRSRT